TDSPLCLPRGSFLPTPAAWFASSPSPPKEESAVAGLSGFLLAGACPALSAAPSPIVAAPRWPVAPRPVQMTLIQRRLHCLLYPAGAQIPNQAHHHIAMKRPQFPRRQL